jgi:hypothetical protein
MSGSARWATWAATGVPFAAALLFLAGASVSASHHDYSHQTGRITTVRVEIDDQDTKLFDIDLDDGEYVNVYWVRQPDSTLEANRFLVPTPLPSDFAVGDELHATIYAGSAIDLVLDHGDTRTHYTSAFYQASGANAAGAQTSTVVAETAAAAAAVGLWGLIAFARAVWVRRQHGNQVGLASFLAATTFTPYLGFAAVGGTEGGHSGSTTVPFVLLVLAILIGLASAVAVRSIFLRSKRSDMTEVTRAEIGLSRTLALFGAIGWLIATGTLAVSLIGLALFSASG